MWKLLGVSRSFQGFSLKFCRVVSQLLVFWMATTSRKASIRGFQSSNLSIVVKDSTKVAMEVMPSVSLQIASIFTSNYDF